MRILTQTKIIRLGLGDFLAFYTWPDEALGARFEKDCGDAVELLMLPALEVKGFDKLDLEQLKNLHISLFYLKKYFK